MQNLSTTAKKGSQTIKEFQTLFEKHIKKYFDEQLVRIEKEFDNGYSKYCIELYKEMCTRKAKRLRASFIYYVYKMLNGANATTAIEMGIIIELMHANWLIIDDFMDLSDTRRGGAAAHKILSQYHKDHNFKNLDSDHFGDAIAVNIGVAGIFMATNLLLGLDLENGITRELAKNISQKMEITAHGQITDVFNAVGIQVSEENVLKMLKWKTGVYTYENPIHLGAIMAGANEDALKKLSEYAIPGGISFQIQDDILGMFGDSEVMGKSAMDDLKEGKYTLLIHKALENADEKQREILNKQVGNRNLTSEEHELVKKIIEDTGSLEYSKLKAKELVEQAKQSLVKNYNPMWNQEGLDYLNNIADYVIERDG